MDKADIYSALLQLNTNDSFISNLTTNWPYQGLSQNCYYSRNDSYTGCYYDMIDHSGITNYSNIIYLNEISGMQQGQIVIVRTTSQGTYGAYAYEKTDIEVPNIEDDYMDITMPTTTDDICQLMLNRANTGDTFSVKNLTIYPGSYKVYVRTSSGTFDMEVGSPLANAPSEPIIGCVYYKANGASDFTGVDQWSNDVLVVYLGDSKYAKLSNLYDTITLADSTEITFYETHDISEYATDISLDCWSSLTTLRSSNVPVTSLTADTLTDKRHYLEINGKEVF